MAHQSEFNKPERSHGKRRFHEIPTLSSNNSPDDENTEIDSKGTSQDLIKFIASDVIGKDYKFQGPYGRRKVVYCDYIASGRALLSIEKYITDKIMPVYGNTHTTTTVTSLQSSMFVQESRLMIRNQVRANEHDAVIFVGSGVTGAVNKLISALSFRTPPVVFVGPFEHHSNLLPWREVAAHVIDISEDVNGQVNIKHLEQALITWKETGLEMVGCFSAASNVTGRVTDTVAVSGLLHAHGCLAVWDYAAAGPYLDIDMHPHNDSDASKDAVFLSMHKFVGGVDCPGVLIAKKALFRNRTPSEQGGGAVFFVSRDSHRYLQDAEAREEAGTPRVAGIVRAALALTLKQRVGVATIMSAERRLRTEAMRVWANCPNLVLLGPCDVTDDDQLAVFSFLVKHRSGKYLHHNYVAALLNDLFGIQTRGGCACAGPYAQQLLGIDKSLADEFENALLEDSRLDRAHLRRQAEYSPHESLRPGFTRLNLSYLCGEREADFVIRAVQMVAARGCQLLPSYMFNPDTAEWRHVDHKVFSDRRWLGQVTFTSRGLEVAEPRADRKGTDLFEFDQVLREAELIFDRAQASDRKLPDHELMFDVAVRHLRWFLLPSEAQHHLANNHHRLPPSPPVFVPPRCIQPLADDVISARVRVPDHVRRLLSKLNDDRHLPEATFGASDVTSGSNDVTADSDDVAPDSADITAGSNDVTSGDSDVTSGGKNQVNGEVEKLIDRVKNLTRNTNHDSTSCVNGTCAIKPRVASLRCDDVIGDVAKRKWVAPPKGMFKQAAQAIADFSMIKPGDRVLVCLSGGKDSLSLLHVLRQYQRYAANKSDHPFTFDLGAVTIDPMTSSYDPSPLIPYLRDLGVSYFYEEQDIFTQATRVAAASICSFCSRMKRGRLYSCARREGWGVLAFGQHLDDLAETFLMSALHNGLLYTMKAHYVVKEGDLRVIRPFVFVREIDTRRFAESAKLPVIPENCPACFDAPKERHRMKQLLASQEILHPRIFHSLRSAMLPLMSRGRDPDDDL